MTPTKKMLRVSKLKIANARSFGFAQIEDTASFENKYGQMVDLSATAEDRGSVAISILSQLAR